MDRHIKLPSTLVFHRQKLTHMTIQLALDQATEATNTMINVNDIIPHLQIGIHGFGCLCHRSLTHARLRTFPAEDLRVGDEVHHRVINSWELRVRGWRLEDEAHRERGFDK